MQVAPAIKQILRAAIWSFPLLLSTTVIAQSVTVDFETGDLSQANFSLSGDGQWLIDAHDASESNLYGLKSPPLEFAAML